MTEAASDTTWWERFETWSPRLFFVGFALELVFAANRGLAYLVDGISFIQWTYPTVLLGRLAVLFGLAGLSVQLVNRNPRVGKLGRGVVSLAIVFTIGLLSLSMLNIVGITTPIIAVVGLGTVVLTILTFLLFGTAIVRTRAHSPLVGGLVLVAALAVVSVFVGLRFLPTNLIGGAGETINALAFLALWHVLRTESGTTQRSATAAEPTTEYR